MTKINRKWNYSFLMILLTAVLSMTGFYLLYCHNNKYTSTKEKAIQGILCIEDFSEDNSVYYLSREWEYYPGVLLTPQEIREQKGNYSSQYLSIGESNKMEHDAKDGSPYGSGTYRMLISLPKKSQTYALLLTEIFSAYRLYINGELVEEVGDPDPAHYRESIQNRVFTFKGSHTVEIMIAVTDKSSLSPGIQYVPVLGTPIQVNTQRGISVLFSLLVVMISLVIMFFSIYIFLKTRVTKAGLFSMICLCTFGYSSYTLLHAYLALKVQPWYAIELLFYVLTFPFMILLLSNIVEEKHKFTYIMAGFTGLCGFLGFLGELLLPGLDSASGISFIANVTELAKWVTALYLIGFSLYSVQKKQCSLILIASVIYGCSVAADQIWPLYEPIIGGWFPEVGGVILVCAFGISVWKNLANAYRLQLAYQEHSRQLEQKLMMQKEHFEELSKKAEEMNRIRHDIRQHLRLLDTYLRQKRYGELETYLHEFTEEYEQKDVVICYCKNLAVDAIIHYYAGHFQDKKIEFECNLEIPEKAGISDIDFCRIFGNLLENAMEAVSHLKKAEKRKVLCTAKIKNEKLLIMVENTCAQSKLQRNDQLLSTKHGGKGIGTVSVREVAEKYGGYADFQMKNGLFQVNMFFPLKNARIQQ